MAFLYFMRFTTFEWVLVALAAVAGSGCRGGYLTGVESDFEISAMVDDFDPDTAQADRDISRTRTTIDLTDGQTHARSERCSYDHVIGSAFAKPGPRSTQTPTARTSQASNSFFFISDPGPYAVDLHVRFQVSLEGGSARFEVGVSLFDDHGAVITGSDQKILFEFAEDPADPASYRVSVNGKDWLSRPDGSSYDYAPPLPPFYLNPGKYRFQLEAVQKAGGATSGAGIQGSASVRLGRPSHSHRPPSP